jgi:hypothetical protein
MELYHKEQRVAAKNIVCHFASVRQATLIAPCQSGKTGTFHCVVEMMASRNMVLSCNVVLLCGSSELALKKQAKAETERYNHADMKVLFLCEMLSAIKKKTVHDKSKPTLIIIDESHLVQNKGQTVNNFLSTCFHIDLGLQSDAQLIENNLYILSVDATPYAEVASYVHRSRDNLFEKHFEFLKPASHYYGIERMLENNLIKSFGNSPLLFMNEFLETSMLEKKTMYRNKFGIYRFPHSNTDHEGKFLETCRKLKIPVYEHSTESLGKRKSNDTNPHIAMRTSEAQGYLQIQCMNNAPSSFTVIIIRGMFRAGYTFECKDHIGFALDAVEHTQTDVTVQGMLGRLCGYYAPGKRPPDMFVPNMMMSTRTSAQLCDVHELNRAVYALKPHNDPNVVTCLLPTIATNIKPCLRLTSAFHPVVHNRKPFPINVIRDNNWIQFTLEMAIEKLSCNYIQKLIEGQVKLNLERSRHSKIEAQTLMTESQRAILVNLIKLEQVVHDFTGELRDFDHPNITVLHHLFRNDGVVKRLKDGVYEEPNNAYMHVYLSYTPVCVLRRDQPIFMMSNQPVSKMYVMFNVPSNVEVEDMPVLAPNDISVHPTENVNIYSIIPLSNGLTMFDNSSLQNHNSKKRRS